MLSLGRESRRARVPLARWTVLLLLLGAFGFPLYWTVTMAFKPGPEWNPAGSVTWYPHQPTLSNFEIALGLRVADESVFLQQPTRSAVRPIVNSLAAAGAGSAVALAFGVLAAYSIARFRTRRRRILPFLALQLRLFPPLVFLIPLFFLWAYVGLWDTLPGLVLAYAGLTFPLALWMMRSFLLDTQRELAEAAIVDGCSHWGAFFKAVLPQVKGGIAATALFIFVLNWSDFVIASVLTGDRAMTAPVFLARLQSDEFERQFGPQAALGLLLMVPPLLLAVLIRRHVVRGLTLGAVRRTRPDALP